MHETGAIKSLVDTVDPNRPAPAFPVNGKSLVSCRGGSGGQVLPHIKKIFGGMSRFCKGSGAAGDTATSKCFFVCFLGEGVKNKHDTVDWLASSQSLCKQDNKYVGGSSDAKVTLVSRQPQGRGRWGGGGASGPRHPGPCEPFDSMQGIGGGGMLQLGLKALFGLG